MDVRPNDDLGEMDGFCCLALLLSVPKQRSTTGLVLKATTVFVNSQSYYFSIFRNWPFYNFEKQLRKARSILTASNSNSNLKPSLCNCIKNGLVERKAPPQKPHGPQSLAHHVDHKNIKNILCDLPHNCPLFL